MPFAHLLQRPGFVRAGIRIDTAPAWWWIAAQFVALWPTWLWMGRRMGDGSDDPLGALALAVLALLVWRARHALRAAPRLHWLALALLATLVATAAAAWLPPLLIGVLAMLALASTLLAFLPHQIAATPVLGLAVLALPLLSSLQFYAGYPLRIVTAEATRWLLASAHALQREGTTLMVNGQMVIVDAPCSGVQMVWLGYFSACVAALWTQVAGRRFLARLPLVSLLVLAGNIVRNTVLVGFEARGQSLQGAAHDAVGLLVLAIVCAAVVRVMASAGTETTA